MVYFTVDRFRFFFNLFSLGTSFNIIAAITVWAFISLNAKTLKTKEFFISMGGTMIRIIQATTFLAIVTGDIYMVLFYFSNPSYSEWTDLFYGLTLLATFPVSYAILDTMYRSARWNLTASDRQYMDWMGFDWNLNQEWTTRIGEATFVLLGIFGAILGQLYYSKGLGSDPELSRSAFHTTLFFGAMYVTSIVGFRRYGEIHGFRGVQLSFSCHLALICLVDILFIF